MSEEQASSGAGADADGAPDGAGPKRRRVLLVDDSEDATFVMGQLLEMRGFEVFRAHTGAEAIALAERERPDAVVLDLGLPDMDGFEVLLRLKRIESLASTRFIALTGRNLADEQQRGRSECFDEQFIKPAEMERLIAALQRSR